MDPLFPDSLELSGLARLSTSPDPHAAAVLVALGRLSRLAARLLGTAGAFVALAQFSPRLATKDFGYGVRIVIAAVSRQALIPVCQRRGGTVGVDGCNASGFPGSP